MILSHGPPVSGGRFLWPLVTKRGTNVRTTEPPDTPTYWFFTMEMAKRQGRFLEAQHALEQLRRLGVDIRFSDGRTSRRRTRKTGGPTDAA
jgi:hypothetical protein